MPTFVFYPPGITVRIVGMDDSTHGRSCCEHHIYGSLLSEDVIFCFWRPQILVEEERAVCHCSLPCFWWDRPLLFWLFKEWKHNKLYKGMLAQVIDVHPCSSASVIISCLPKETILQMTSLKEHNDMDSKQLLA